MFFFEIKLSLSLSLSLYIWLYGNKKHQGKWLKMEIIACGQKAVMFIFLDIARDVFKFQVSAERARHGHVTGTQTLFPQIDGIAVAARARHGYGQLHCETRHSTLPHQPPHRIGWQSPTLPRHGVQTAVARVRPGIWPQVLFLLSGSCV